MSLLRRGSYGWVFNEGGRFFTASSIETRHGERMVRLWVHGLALLWRKGAMCSPRFAMTYRDKMLWRK